MEDKTFKIISLEEKPVSQYNKYPSYKLRINLGGEEIDAYANTGKWNSHWAVNVDARAMVEKRQSKQGTQYCQLKCPEDLNTGKSSNGGGSQPQANNVGLGEILALLRDINTVLHIAFHDKLNDKSAELAGIEKEVDVEDIPFGEDE